MLRAYLEPLFFLSLPFLVYGMFLLVQQRFPQLALPQISIRLRNLLMTGLLLALGSFIILTLLAPPKHGTYVPAHVENGRLVPGYLKDESAP